MRKTIRIMMWFLRKLYQCDKKRFGSMAALIVIRAIKTLLSVITIKVALDCVVTYHSFLYLVIFVATERVVSSLLALIESKIDWRDKCLSQASPQYYIMPFRTFRHVRTIL